IFIGGSKMKELKGYGWAITGSILCIFPGMCCVCIGLIPGIWGLVVLLNPDVKYADSRLASGEGGAVRERERPPRYTDLRDDYDDEFGRALSPREVARRRVFAPAVAFIVTGCLGIGGSLIGAGAVVSNILARPRPAGEQMLLLVLCCLGV